jgi:hypothetical protein
MSIPDPLKYQTRWQRFARTWSIPFPWLDRPDFYRSGRPTRTLAAHFAGTIWKKFMHMHKTYDAFSEICAMFHAEAQESPGAADKEKT